ncbi:MAG TPA: hypothetical protein VNW92_12725 [Polyangiaceae bacterium]|jgi:hypothetical protein|nr:hypothetical protein [Polyangiaceae bacterium]
MRGSQFPKPKIKLIPSSHDAAATLFVTQLEHAARENHWLKSRAQRFADPFLK